MPLLTVEQAIADYRAGKLIIIVDDEDRENEGDLAVAAELATPEAINFMARFGRGLICLPMTTKRLDELELPLMVPEGDNSSRFGTAFTVSIEARRGVTTGISAYDRAHTIRVAVDPHTRPGDLARPGHIFPLRAAEGGVLQRCGQTEAAVDLARLAGLIPAGVICEVMRDDGRMARMPDLEVFSAEHGIGIVTIERLVKYRVENEFGVGATAARKV
jgi:3,4-dihydroxy 2-butanone 4-phosphate synthase/GTP cyclohydrolase II